MIHPRGTPSVIRIASVATVTILTLGRGRAAADDCSALGGTIAGGECRISSVVSRSGAYSLDETLHILGNGRINVPAVVEGNFLTLSITGDLIVEVPTVTGRGRISSDVSGHRAVGATITVTATGNIRVAGSAAAGGRISSTQTSASCTSGQAGSLFLTAVGSFVAERNSVLSVNGSCPAGEIQLRAQDIDIAGQVLSESNHRRLGDPASCRWPDHHCCRLSAARGQHRVDPQ